MGMNDTDINSFNLKIRQQPWYQDWFKQRGLDPNNVKLNDDQRRELKALVERHSGFTLPGDMKIDPAGNLNEKGGWAGLPVGVKIAIIAGATLATAGAAGAFSGAAAPSAIAGSGGSTVAGGALPTIGATAYGTGMATAPSIAGLTGAATGGGGLLATLGSVARSAAPIAGRMLGSVAQSQANNRGVEMDARMQHDALQLAGNRDRRDAESDAYRKSLFGQLAEGYQPSSRPAGAEGRHPTGFITDEARQAGSLMTDIARKRMETGDYPGITPFEQLPTRPGLMENIANYAAPALSLFDPRLYGR